MSNSQVKTIQSLARGIEVLHIVQGSGPIRLHDLHLKSGLPKATLLRILKTLMERGVVWQRMLDGAYLPSFSLVELAGYADREQALVEVASPVLERLTAEVEWPSTLAVPRLTYMEVLESNVSRSNFDHIRLGPVGFQVNILRSASGRAYLGAIQPALRDPVLAALKKSDRKGDRLAHSDAYVSKAIADAQAQGYGLRDPDFGGHYDEGRDRADDGRDSVAMAIRLGNHVPGTINITWSKRAYGRAEALPRLIPPMQRAVDEIANTLAR